MIENEDQLAVIRKKLSAFRQEVRRQRLDDVVTLEGVAIRDVIVDAMEAEIVRLQAEVDSYVRTQIVHPEQSLRKAFRLLVQHNWMVYSLVDKAGVACWFVGRPNNVEVLSVAHANNPVDALLKTEDWKGET